MEEQAKVVLTEDGTATEGRAFGHVIMTIDGVETDVYFGTNGDGNETQIAALEAIVKANAEESGRPFIIAGWQFSSVSTFAGHTVKTTTATPGHAVIVSTDGDLSVASTEVYAKTKVGIAAAAISDQIWVEFGEPSVEDQPEEDDGITKVMAWWLNSWQNETEVTAMIQQIKETDADIAAIIAAGNVRYADITVEQYVEMTGYEYWHYEPNVTKENGTTQGCLMLSKTPLTFVEQVPYTETRKFSHLTTEINNRELDLFMGWDINYGTAESYVKEIADASGNDFIIFGHNFKGVGATYAGREVVNVNDASSNTALIVSHENQEIIGTEVVAKDAALSWAGHTNQVIANLEITPKPEDTEVMTTKQVKVMGWLVNGMDSTAEIETVAAKVAKEAPDILTLLCVNETANGVVDADDIAAKLGYINYHYCSYEKAGYAAGGYLVLSKYPVTFKESQVTARNTTISYLTVDIGGKSLDLYVGHDFVIDTYASWIQANYEASGSDFIVCGHYINNYTDTVAGKNVEYVNNGTVYLMASTDNLTVTAKECKDKPESLTDGRINTIFTMELEVTVPKD